MQRVNDPFVSKTVHFFDSLGEGGRAESSARLIFEAMIKEGLKGVQREYRGRCAPPRAPSMSAPSCGALCLAARPDIIIL